MKVTHQSADRLVLENRPWFWAILVALVGLLFLGIGVVFMMLAQSDGEALSGGAWRAGMGLASLVFGRFLVQTSRFEFDREKGLIAITRQSPRGKREHLVALGDVTKATVFSAGKGRAGAMALLLRHPFEPVYFTRHRTSGPRPGRMAGTVNDWLKLKPIVPVDPDAMNSEVDESPVVVIGSLSRSEPRASGRQKAPYK